MVKSTEMVVSELTKEKPTSSFLTITVEGIKEATKVAEEIAPTVLAVAAFALA